MSEQPNGRVERKDHRNHRNHRNRRKLMIRRTIILAVLVIGAVVLMVVLPGVFRSHDRYVPGQPVEGITRSLERASNHGESPFEFHDVTADAGIEFHHFAGRRSTQLPEDMGSGAAWGDYDGDGDADLYLVDVAGPLTMSDEERAHSSSGNTLFENLGNGRFRDATDDAGVGCSVIGMGACWGDVDADGDLDLFTTAYGENHLFVNDGDGRFHDGSHVAGLSGSGFWTGCAFADYDNDGDLDLYVGGYVQYSFDPADTLRSSKQYESVLPHTLNPSSYEPHGNHLYRNRGDGTFDEVAAAAGVEDTEGRSLSVSWCDFDLDGWQDLYVANDVSDNAMYRNRGDGTFEDVSHSAWVADYRGAMGLAVDDWDADGDFDIVVTHWMAQENALYTNLLQETPASAMRTMRFVDEADGKGLGQIALDYIGWGTVTADLDADGLLDLLIVNGSTFPDKEHPLRLVPMRDLLFWNRGSQEGFYEVGLQASPYFEVEAGSRGAAAADYDLDGDLDLLIMRFQGSPVLLRNDGRRQSWLEVRVEGPGGAPSCPGALVKVIAGPSSWIKQIGASASYLSQNEAIAYFGLGQAAQADTIEVRRPRRELLRLTNVQANTMVEVPWDSERG